MRKWVEQRARHHADRWSVERGLDAIGLLWMLVRISLVIFVWILLFLGVFTGYLTISLVLLIAFILAYMALDLRRPIRKLLARRRIDVK
ncbi:MAG: hypothetical protein M1343_01110 [Chloroflexi bacterium]|nr:hypothetical protein [Chloroflexota bacterium]MDA8187874.1 hypothetical protein [Dehalococcoidales bacterium]